MKNKWTTKFQLHLESLYTVNVIKNILPTVILKIVLTEPGKKLKSALFFPKVMHKLQILKNIKK